MVVAPPLPKFLLIPSDTKSGVMKLPTKMESHIGKSKVLCPLKPFWGQNHEEYNKKR